MSAIFLRSSALAPGVIGWTAMALIAGNFLTKRGDSHERQRKLVPPGHVHRPAMIENDLDGVIGQNCLSNL
jgi:hypothetical protein